MSELGMKPGVARPQDPDGGEANLSDTEILRDLDPKQIPPRWNA